MHFIQVDGYGREKNCTWGKNEIACRVHLSERRCRALLLLLSFHCCLPSSFIHCFSTAAVFPSSFIRFTSSPTFLLVVDYLPLLLSSPLPTFLFSLSIYISLSLSFSLYLVRSLTLPIARRKESSALSQLFSR